MLGESRSAVLFKFALRNFWVKIKSYIAEYGSETEQNDTTIIQEGYTSQTRLLLSLIQYKNNCNLDPNYNWKVALRKFHSVYIEIKKGNLKNKV